MTFELTRIWIRIPMQVLKHLEIDLNLENGVLPYPQFLDSVQCLTTICYTSLPRTIDIRASFVWPLLSRGWRPPSRPKSSMRSLKSFRPHSKIFSGRSIRLGRPNPRPKNNEHCCIIQMAISMYLFNFTKWVLVPVQGCNQEFGLGKQSQWVGIICHPWLR